MEDQGKKIKINGDNYGVAFGDVLDITNIKIEVLGSIKFMQDAISAAKQEKLKYIVGKKFTDSLNDGFLGACFSGADAADRMNRIEYSEDKKDWHEVDESPKNDGRLKGKQQVYFRYRIYYQ